MRKKNQIEDLTGQRFGLLTVTSMNKVELECEIRTGCTYICDCGALGTTIARYLKRGSKEHCGSFECKKKLNAQRMQSSYKPHEDHFGVKNYAN